MSLALICVRSGVSKTFETEDSSTPTHLSRCLLIIVAYTLQQRLSKLAHDPYGSERQALLRKVGMQRGKELLCRVRLQFGRMADEANES